MHEQLKLAREFALKAHSNQIYGNIYPYYRHLEDVYKVLIRFGFNERDHLNLLAASFLHDTIEDTGTSYNDIKKVFGEEIAEIVFCMSDEMGRNRKEKKEKTYPKTRSNPNSVILKVADRIANAEFSVNEGSRQAAMYREEYKEFEYHLRIHSQIDLMWEHLHYILFKDIIPEDSGITEIMSDVGEQT
jgi:(p)ppGpp synthase/HD superfamily hydrolase